MSKRKCFNVFLMVFFAFVLFGCKKEEVKIHPQFDKNAAEEECAVLVIPKDAVVKRIDGKKRGFLKSWDTGVKAGTVLVPAGEHTFTFEYSQPQEGWTAKDLVYTAEMKAKKMYMVSVAIDERAKGGKVSTAINIAASSVRDRVIDKIPFFDSLPRSKPRGLEYRIDEINQTTFDQYLLGTDTKTTAGIRVLSVLFVFVVIFAVTIIRSLAYNFFMGRFKNRHHVLAVVLGIGLIIVGILALNYNSSGGLLLYLLAIILIGFGWSFQDMGASANKRGLAALGEGEGFEYSDDVSDGIEDIIGNLSAGKYKNKFEKAIFHFNKAIQQSPLNPIFIYNRGIALTNLQAWKEAIDDFTRAISLSPNVAVFYNIRGVAYSNLQDWKKAAADFAEAVRLDPYNDTFKQNLASTQTNNTSASNKLTNNTSNAEEQANSSNKSGVEKLDKNDFEGALRDFNSSINIYPNNPVYYYNRGITYSNLKDSEKAIADFSAAIKLDSKNALYFNQRGIAYYNTQNWEKAAADFTEASRLDPSNDTFKNNLAAAKDAQLGK